MEMNINNMEFHTMNVFMCDSLESTPQVPNGRYYMKLASDINKALYAPKTGITVSTNDFSSTDPSFI